MDERDLEKAELFNIWNEKQKQLDASIRKILFKEGEIWWCAIGINIGEEVYGKGKNFMRPVVILKRFSRTTCLVIPMTTKLQTGTWYYELNTNGLKRFAMMHQIRFISGKRLIERTASLLDSDFHELKKSVASLLGLSSILSEPKSRVVGNPKDVNIQSISNPISDANNSMLGIHGESGRIEGMATAKMAPQFTKTTPEFEEAYARLNDEQKAAVDAINGPVFVVAGPGTGKTQVLALRIANILKLTDTSPESILALTFTEVGAREMRARLAKLIGSTTAWKIRIHTFHGFAQSLVTRFPDQFPRIIGAEIATDAERAEILEEAILNPEVKLKLLRPFGDPLWYHYEITKAISTMKRENVTLDALAERVREAEKDFDAIPGKVHEKGKYEGKMKGEFETLQKKIAKTKELLVVYEQYEKGLEAKKRYDFEDVILEVVRAFEGDAANADAFKREVQEGILYVLADEHQDANKSQNALLEHLTDYDTHPNLFIVGDEKQAIYRFQGADLDNVHYFRERFTGTQVIVLTQNYRSTQTILDSALSLIAASPDERLSRLPLSSNSDTATITSRPITVATASTPEAEADYLAEQIQMLLNGTAEVARGVNVSAEDIAILARRNRDVAYLTDALVKRGVPVAASGEERNALADPYVMALRRLLEAVNEQRDERLSSVLTLPGFKISAADAWRITNAARASYVSAFQVLAKDDLLEHAMLIDKKAARTLYEKLVHLGSLASYERPAIVAQVAFKDSGLLDSMLGVPTRDRHFGAIRAFFNLLEEISKREHDALLPRALQLLTLYDERGIPLKGQEEETLSAGKVKIMTAHKSKGREFRFVFVPRLTESAWSTRNRPEHFYLPDILSGATELEDERRLLYVAMTRAKEHLTISYSLLRDDGKETAPSALVEDIDATVASGLVELVSVEESIGVHEQNPLVFLPDAGKSHSRNHNNEPSDDDRETLRNAFLAQGLSPTGLNNYLECPSKYFYVNLLRLPEPENKYMLFGTAIHAALKSYADRRTRGDDVPGDYIVTEFNRVLAKSPLSVRDLEDLKEKGKRALLAWWRENQVSWPSMTETEIGVEAPFVLADGSQITVRGKLDRVDPLSGDTVRVIDYKTGKPKSRNELMGKTAATEGEGGGNYFRQLVFYKMLLARTDIPREMTEGMIEFVEPDDKDNLKKEIFEITTEDVAELESEIQRVAAEIMSLSFWSARCTNDECPWCALRFGII
jgi:DNA helicase-2/ATP-dependent DNA helicase PcrA